MLCEPHSSRPTRKYVKAMACIGITYVTIRISKLYLKEEKVRLALLSNLSRESERCRIQFKRNGNLFSPLAAALSNTGLSGADYLLRVFRTVTELERGELPRLEAGTMNRKRSLQLRVLQ